jgi:hypothetical protein
MIYLNKDNFEIRELPNDLVEMWQTTNNPKLNSWILLPEKPSNDAVWNGDQWIVPQPEIPQTISARQIRLWLIQNGFILSQIDQAINSIADPIVREITKVEWEYAPYIERNHPWLEPLANSLGLNSSQIDQAFLESSQL